MRRSRVPRRRFGQQQQAAHGGGAEFEAVVEDHQGPCRSEDTNRRYSADWLPSLAPQGLGRDAPAARQVAAPQQHAKWGLSREQRAERPPEERLLGSFSVHIGKSALGKALSLSRHRPKTAGHVRGCGSVSLVGRHQQQAVHLLSLKGSSKCFFVQVVFAGLGYHGQKTTQFQETSVLLDLPPSAARPQTTCFLKMCGFLGLVPQASKKHLANTNTSGSL